MDSLEYLECGWELSPVADFGYMHVLVLNEQRVIYSKVYSCYMNEYQKLTFTGTLHVSSIILSLNVYTIPSLAGCLLKQKVVDKWNIYVAFS